MAELKCRIIVVLKSTEEYIVIFSHGMAYAIAGNVKTYKCKDYEVDHALVVSLSNFSL